MARRTLAALFAISAPFLYAQELSTNPFPTPIEAQQDVLRVHTREFARIPFDEAGFAPRMMHMVTEAGTDQRFVSVMTGPLYAINADGSNVHLYVDINDPAWNVRVMSAGSERGVQSMAFHPQFNEAGTPGYGKFYTYVDVSNDNQPADFVSGGERRSHDTVLLEWTAKDAGGARYDGDSPRVLFRAAQPFPNHNGSQIAFNPLARPGDSDYGMLYVGLADGGSGGDPMNVAQNLANAFGKILRLDPLGTTSTNGQYGIPADNPFVADGRDDTLAEIFAYGVRNPQRFNWDSANGTLYLADIGQNQVEEISPVTAGANLGWNTWEGSYRYVNREVSLDAPRSENGITWPIAEYDHADPLLQRQVAITGIVISRNASLPLLQNKIVFGDNPSGEMFYVEADASHAGGQAAIRRILLDEGGTAKTFLQVIQETNRAAGQDIAPRADLRFGYGPDNGIYLLNKHDGIIRQVIP